MSPSIMYLHPRRVNFPLDHGIHVHRSDRQIDRKWLVKGAQDLAGLEVPPWGGGIGGGRGEGMELVEDVGVDGAVAEEDLAEATTCWAGGDA